MVGFIGINISLSKDEQKMALRAFLYSCLTSARVYLNTTAHVGDAHRVSSLAQAGSLVLLKTGFAGSRKKSDLSESDLQMIFPVSF